MTNPNHNQKSALSQDDLRGVLLPITTPFKENGELDLVGLRANIRKWNGTGIIGYVMLGSTGERVHLDEREFLQVVATAREEVPPHLRFVVGAGQQSVWGTIKEIQRVSEVGPIDAVLVITPSFYRTSSSQSTLIDYYRVVADASPVPVILYSMPALTGIKIEPETAAHLSKHQNIIGIKDSSADIDGFRETVGQVVNDFAVLTGNGTVLAEALCAGACGAILAVGCVAPALCLKIMDAHKSGATEAAAQLQRQLSPLASAVTSRFGLGGLKAALDMNGYAGGFVRAPLRMPDEAAREEIRRCLLEANQAGDADGERAQVLLPDL